MSRDDPRASEEARQEVTALRQLLGDAIDYAGLFPPAQLDMSGAVAEYASYLQSPERWALGRFVVPASRLEELATEAALAYGDAPLGASRAAWRLSVLLGPDVGADLGRVRVFDDSQEHDALWSARTEALELRATTPEQIQNAARLGAAGYECFVEIPIAADPSALIDAIGTAGLFAKARTGGVTADAFPTSDQLARFLATCVATGVRFKATAGLHHPLRGEYALTYADDSASGTMFGFLNVFLATAFLRTGATVDATRELLEERDPRAFQFDAGGVTWRGQRVTLNDLQSARRVGIASFGSCSFREPIDDLESLGML